MDYKQLIRGRKSSAKLQFYNTKILEYKNQNYEDLKRECLNSNTLFEDPLFPAYDTSISYTRYPPYGTTWKRPSEIVESPDEAMFMIGEDCDCDDLDQGALGNCWFIAGCAAIALVPDLFHRVVPKDQPMNGSDYAGIFHFRFWINGDWCDVVIDDRLPVNESNQLIFCSNRKQPNEFWPALLEKAYAKVCLSYENLDGGLTTDSLIDMTGGIQEMFDLKDAATQAKKDQIWQLMIKSRLHSSLIGCSIAANPLIKEARLKNGLVMGHAYTVTKVALLEMYGREQRLLSNFELPWGNEVEWIGPWSDNSYEWRRVDQSIKEQLGYKNSPDGEFWMSFEDFCKNFEAIELCDLTPTSYSDEVINNNNNKSNKTEWKLVGYHGEWVYGQSAGGSGQGENNYEADSSYWTNPQFLISLKDVDPDDNENLATLIVSLMQKNTREKRMQLNGESAEEFIQFRLYRVLDHMATREARTSGVRFYADQLDLVGASGPYINLRDVTKRFRVPPGDYVVIPIRYI